MADHWEYQVTIHNRPGHEETTMYGFLVLRNERVVYREQMSHTDLRAANETAEETTYHLMERLEREEIAKGTRGQKHLAAAAQNASEVRSILERVGMAVPAEYKTLMAEIDKQEAELEEQGISMRRVYLSDENYDLLVGVAKENARDPAEAAWWDRNPLGKLESNGHWAQLYRLPDELQHKGVIVTFSDLQELHDLVKVKQRVQAEPDPPELSGIAQPAWEFLERKGVERHEPDPWPNDRKAPPAFDWNRLLQRSLRDPEENDDDGA